MSISGLNSAIAGPRIDEIALQLIPSSTSGDAATLSLSSLTGSVIVLFVFGVDCGTCKHLVRTLSDFRSELHPNVEIIGVCVQSGCEERLEAFRSISGAELKLAHSSTRQLCLALHLPPATWLFYPTLIFIDHKQSMRRCFIGGDSFFDDSQANLRKTLEELLAEQREDAALETNEKVEAQV